MRRHPLVLISLAIATAVSVSACAGTASGLRPAPFPGRPVPVSAMGAGIARTALALQGIPYGVGGNRPETGFDCSGLVRYVFAQHQIAVPRTVAEQWQTGESVPLAEVRAGDLIFFRTTGGGASHVGIALGPRGRARFVHAPVSGGVVRVEEVDAAYWRDRLVGVRRVGASREGR